MVNYAKDYYLSLFMCKTTGSLHIIKTKAPLNNHFSYKKIAYMKGFFANLTLLSMTMIHLRRKYVTASQTLWKDSSPHKRHAPVPKEFVALCKSWKSSVASVLGGLMFIQSAHCRWASPQISAAPAVKYWRPFAEDILKLILFNARQQTQEPTRYVDKETWPTIPGQ